MNSPYYIVGQVGVLDWELSGYASEMLEIGSHMARDPDAACKGDQ